MQAPAIFQRLHAFASVHSRRFRLDDMLQLKAQKDEMMRNFEEVQAETAANAARASAAVEELQAVAFQRLGQHDERCAP